MSANIFQRQLMARRLLWIMVGPEVLQRLKFPWHKLASRPLPKGWLGTVKPPPPEPEPVPVTPTPEPVPEPTTPTPEPEPVFVCPPGPEPPEPPEPEPEPEPEPITPTPEPEPEPIIPTPEPEPVPPKPYRPPPIYIAPWEPGPPRRRVPSPPGVKEAIVYADTDDGYIWASSGTWSVVHGAASGGIKADTVQASNNTISVCRLSAGSRRIWRSFFRFDLSALGGIRIKSAILRITCYSYHATDVAVQEGTQHSPLVLADYSAFTGLGFAARTWTAGFNDLELNAEGIAFLLSKRGSSAKFCCREYSHDYMNVEPAFTVNYRNGCCYSEWGTTTQKPQLILTY